MKPAGKGVKDQTMLSRGLHVEMLEPRLLLSADLIPIVGEIEVPGETDFYTFELAEERTVVFDSLTNRGDLNWSLSGTGGQIVSPTDLSASDGAQGGQLLALDAGTYTLAIDGEGDAQGEYQFRLLNTDNATQITTDTIVDGVLESQGRETDLFQFDATAGTELFFDARSISNGTAYWQLIDPDGVTIFGPRTFSGSNDPVRLQIAKTGTYTLLLEGYVHNSGDRAYSFQVSRVVDETRAVTLDDVIEGTISQPGQRHDLTFTLAQDTQVIFDTLLNSSLQFSLVGPRGAERSDLRIDRTDGSYNNSVLNLLAGDYTLTVFADSDLTGDYAFQLLTAASSQQIDLADMVTGTLDDQGIQHRMSRVASTAPLTGDAGLAQHFDDLSPTVQIADSAELNPTAFTIETWVRPERNNSFEFIAVKSSSNSLQDGYGLYLNGNGGINFYLNRYWQTASSVTADITLNTWQHVAASFDGAKLRLYIDGELQAESDFSQAINHSSSPLVLGGGIEGFNRFQGQMDEFRLWDSALFQQEIADRRMSVLSAADGLELSLGFDATAPGANEDRSGNNLATSLTQGPATEARLFHFDAAGGEQLVVGTQVSGQTVYMRVIDPSGATIFGPNSSRGADLVLPDIAGRYQVIVDGHVGNTRAADFSLMLVPAVEQTLSLTLDQKIEGELTAMGQAHSYGFTLTGETELYFDSLSNRQDITWQLIGPRGIEKSPRNLNVSDSFGNAGNALFSLPAGDYRLVIDGRDGAIGTYGFRLADLGSAATASYGDEVDATLSPGNSTVMVRFLATAGDLLSLPRTEGNPIGRLVDPFGRDIFRNTQFLDVNDRLLEVSGLYTLIIEGYPSDGWQDPLNQKFTLEKSGTATVPPLTGTALTLGATINGNVTDASTPDTFAFTLAAPTLGYFDAINSPDANGRWTLRGPGGTYVEARHFNRTDGYNTSGSAVLMLPAGSYQLIIDMDGGTGSYSFRALDLATAPAVTAGTEVTGSLDPRPTTAVHSFTGTAGQTCPAVPVKL
jgi:hypothetical protein